MEKSDIIKRSILLVIILYLFLLSIKMMGISFKLFGTGFAEQLISLTINPFVAFFIGILATAIVQSSSVTTSIVVGLAATGTLNVGNAIPLIMGANIGTSVTNTIVSLAHITRREEFRKAFQVATVHDFFNFTVVIIIFPLEMFTHVLEKSAVFLTEFFLGANMAVQFSSPLDYIIKPAAHLLQTLLFSSPIPILILSFAMLFFSLKYFGKIIKPLAESQFRDSLNKVLFKTPLRSFGFGLVLTTIVQSSSVSTSLLVPLVGVGVLAFDRVFPYILGANIGTTVTAFLASLAMGSPAGVVVALEHVLFNIFGSIMIYPIRKIPIGLSTALAQLSYRSKIYPFVYIVSMFYLVPSAVVIFLH